VSLVATPTQEIGPTVVRIELNLGHGVPCERMLRLLWTLEELARAVGGEHVRVSDAPARRSVPAAVRVYLHSRTVRRGGEQVDLTRREFDLLRFLAEHPRQVFTRQQLLRQVWGDEHAAGRTVDVHVRRLRMALGGVVHAAILLFQITESAIMFVVILGAAPSVANGLIGGIDYVPPAWLRAGKVLGMRGLSLYRHVILPASLPSFLSGLKQGWAFAWRSLMAGELLVIVAGQGSIGALLQGARELTRAYRVLSWIIVILLIGILVDIAFKTADQRLRRRWGWRSTSADGATELWWYSSVARIRGYLRSWIGVVKLASGHNGVWRLALAPATRQCLAR
jgi:binding-protein-dependent transport system inner membrane component